MQADRYFNWNYWFLRCWIKLPTFGWMWLVRMSLMCRLTADVLILFLRRKNIRAKCRHSLCKREFISTEIQNDIENGPFAERQTSQTFFSTSNYFFFTFHTEKKLWICLSRINYESFSFDKVFVFHFPAYLFQITHFSILLSFFSSATLQFVFQ